MTFFNNEENLKRRKYKDEGYYVCNQYRMNALVDGMTGIIKT